MTDERKPRAGAPSDAPGKRKTKRAPTAAHFRKAAKRHALDALETLAGLAQSASSESVRVSAANAVLDRAFGKAVAGSRAAEEESPGDEDGEVEVVWLGSAKS